MIFSSFSNQIEWTIKLHCSEKKKNNLPAEMVSVSTQIRISDGLAVDVDATPIELSSAINTGRFSTATEFADDDALDTTARLFFNCDSKINFE